MTGLRGRTVVTTRDEPGELDRRLRAAGAEVVHVPLITIADIDDEAPLVAAIDALATTDWLVVTSKHGARRLGIAAAQHPHLKLAAVGTATAHELAVLAGRPVDVVPTVQTGAGLLAVMPDGAAQSLTIAQADRAASTLADGLGERGFAVRSVTAYQTLTRHPNPAERTAALAADAVAFASGSAARAWADAIGTETPGRVVAIGPTTAAVAAAVGLQVDCVAADHSIDGLVEAITKCLSG